MVKTPDGRVFLVAAPYAKRYPLGQSAESLICPQN
jgi:1,4-alpha-glucan branching enzyme